MSTEWPELTLWLPQIDEMPRWETPDDPHETYVPLSKVRERLLSDEAVEILAVRLYNDYVAEGPPPRYTWPANEAKDGWRAEARGHLEALVAVFPQEPGEEGK